MEVLILVGTMLALLALVIIAFILHMRAVSRGRAKPRSVGMMRFVMFIGVVVAVGLPLSSYVGLLEWDRRVNHAEAAGRVVRIEPICLLATRGRRGGETRGEPMDCLLARSYLQRPEYRGNRVVQLRRITFGYVSPADGRRHEASLDVESSYRPVRAGETVRILAHKRKPERITLP